jgi:2-oxoglutarate ferredoxin oxidoreductase subunit beta
MSTAEPVTKKDFKSDQEVRWCPGCGDYGILNAVQKALMPSSASPGEHVFVSGIGCSSRFPYYMNTYGMHSDPRPRAGDRHRRVKLANPDLDVWVSPVTATACRSAATT